MNITDINKTKRGRFSVFIDGDFYGVLHGDVYITSHIKIGDSIPQKQLNELIYKSQIVIAKERALRLLSARSYTRRKLRDKLLTDVDEPAADEVLDRMEDLGLINDLDYAIRYSKDAINLNGFSHSRITTALFQKGIQKEVIEEALLTVGQEDSEKLIFKNIKKKYYNKIHTEDDIRRTINALHRRGFRYSDIKLVIDRLTEDVDYYKDYWEE